MKKYIILYFVMAIARRYVPDDSQVGPIIEDAKVLKNS